MIHLRNFLASLITITFLISASTVTPAATILLKRLLSRFKMSSCSNCHCSSANAKANASEFYAVREVGTKNSTDYKLYLENASGQVISPFHDVPLYPQAGRKDIVNFFIEIPRWTNAKMEISKEIMMNPIVQDVKKGALRYVKNIFPYTGYPWNYGALPQTWEDPHAKDSATGFNGDNDPIDAIEVGGAVAKPGTIKQVKILGCLALLDEGETDWKIFVVDVNDPMAEQLNDMNDVETHCPGLIDATREWFRSYKIPDGKPANEFAFDGQVKGRDFAIHIVEETAAAWKRLIGGQVARGEIACTTRTQESSPYLISPAEEAQIPHREMGPKMPAPVDPVHTRWVFLKN